MGNHPFLYMEYKKKGDNLIIICRGYGFHDAPKKKPDNTDLWTINNHIYARQEDVDLLWNMHMFEHYGPEELNPVKLANALKIPIMMPKTYKEIPYSIEFPLEMIVNKFGSDYFMTAMPYMFAYAMHLGYKKIDCWGMNMLGHGEVYKNGKACVEYWIGRAQGLGIEVNIHGRYNICLKTNDRRLYGYGNLFQQFPETIEDIALYYTFVTGLDIDGLSKFHTFLNSQERSKYYKNFNPISYGLIRRIIEVNLKVTLDMISLDENNGNSKYVGDVSMSYLNSLDYIRTVNHSAKVICVKSNEEDTMNQWFNAYEGYNMWTNPDSSHWNGDKPHPDARLFPKFDMPKKKAFRKCYKRYLKEAEIQARRYPFNVKVVDKSILDSKEGRKEILEFIGYEKDNTCR